MTRLLAVLAIGVLVSPSGWVQHQTFRSSTDAVRIDVAVTRRGNTVTGLSAVNFELRDSGVLQDIALVERESLPLHLVVAIDLSGSVDGWRLEALKTAARAAIGSLRPDDSVTILTFARALQRPVWHSRDRALVDRAIDDLQAEGSTSIIDAVFAALASVGGDERSLVLLFTDGFDTSSWLSPLAVIEQARRSDVVIGAVVLDESLSRFRTMQGEVLPAERRRRFEHEPDLFIGEFVPALTAETGGDLLVASDAATLRDAFLKTLSTFRERYLLAYSPKGVPRPGWHPIEVRLHAARGTVRARSGYFR